MNRNAADASSPARGPHRPAEGRDPRRPNLLLIMTDQQSASAMSCAGNEYLHTPAMDSLAASGVLFDNSYCTNPLCVPSRAGMFSGRMPHQAGAPYNVSASDDLTDLPLMGRLLADAGYQCSYVGKWHLPVPQKNVDQHGFELLPGAPDAGVPPTCDEFFRRRHERPFLLVASLVNPHNICEWARGQHLPHGDIGPLPPPEDCPPLMPNAAIPAEEPEVLRQINDGTTKQYPTQGWPADKWRQYRWAYHRMVELVDAHVGTILDSLRRSGLEEETVVIFTSDHGDGQGAHDWNQKQVLYEEPVRVPLIISRKGSGRPPMVDRSHLVSTGLDLLPTVCDYAGAAVPHYALGASLRPLVEGRQSARPWRDCVFAETAFCEFDKPTGIRGRMARTARYKYIVYSAGQRREQLFDLEEDPGEMRNLASSPAHVGVLQDHRQRLQEWLLAIGDPFAAELDDWLTAHKLAVPKRCP